MADYDGLKVKIKHKASALGFNLIGVTSCEKPEGMDVYLAWIGNGYHGSMAWMATERALKRRADPREILPQCKSILVLGMSYAVSKDYPSRDGYGRVASYAWGEDYHDVIPPLLQELVAFIEMQIGAEVPHRCYIDTGPILERELAQRAGLGWVGKNSCLINPTLGSYFFLAEILLGIELEPDQPFWLDRCGSCTRCIDACPTECILPNRTIDATRCVSYLTIELRADIPENLRSKIGDWVFGCDICQQVCPWNQRVNDIIILDVFKPGENLPYLKLDNSIAQKEDTFKQTYKKSPIKRAKRHGFLRNVVIAAGNQRKDKSMDLLERLLFSDPKPVVRKHAAWALGKVQSHDSLGILRRALKAETNPEVANAIKQALGMEIDSTEKP